MRSAIGPGGIAQELGGTIVPSGGVRGSRERGSGGTMLTGSGRDLDQARRLERGLIALRWFVVAFGVFQTALQIEGRTPAPTYAVPLAFVLVGLLAIGNVVISVLTEGATRVERLRAIGFVAFALDLGVILGLVW